MWYPLILFLALSVNAKQSTPALTPLAKAIRFLGKKHRVKVSKARAVKLSHLFIKYGKMWRVDPWIAASVAWQESKFTDRPRKVLVERCKTVVDAVYGDVEICKLKWPGERGMMQVVPRYSRDSFTACKGRSWNDPNEMYETETNVCVSMHLMAARRTKVRTRKSFVLRGGRGRWTTRHAPCGRRQIKFCRNGYGALCKKFWWVASWNWGSHRVICTSHGRFDFAGYPIRAIKRYRLITRKFRKKKERR